MDIKTFAQQFAPHGRAFDMPTGATHAVTTLPLGILRLCGFGRLPQHKVERILFAVVYGDALACLQLVK